MYFLSLVVLTAFQTALYAESAPVLTGTPVSSSSIKLQWNDLGAGETAYHLERSSSPDSNFSARAVLGSNTTAYTDTALIYSTTYYYRIRAIKTVKGITTYWPYSEVAAITTLPDTTAPVRPTGLAAVAISYTQVDLSWLTTTDKGGSGLKGYSVYVGTTLFATILAPETSVSVTGLVPNKNFQLKVDAFDHSGNVSSKAVIYAATLPDTIAPTVPTSLTGNAISDSQIALSWNASSDGDGSGVKYYLLYRNGVLVGQVESPTLSFTDSNLLPSIRYRYQVAAKDLGGKLSAKTAYLYVTTLPDATPPSVPHDLFVSAASSDQATLKWKSSVDNAGGSGVAGYKIYQNGSFLKQVTATYTSAIGLNHDDHYFFTVSAVDVKGNESSVCSPVEPPSIDGPVVSIDDVATHHDTVPRFCKSPNISAISDGNWSRPEIWSLGRIPQTGDKVSIPLDKTVTYDTNSSAAITCIEIEGTLTFSRTVDTLLKVGDLMVMPVGTLDVGTESSPIPVDRKSEIMIADKPLDTAGIDPKQYGTGLITFGTTNFHGATTSITWTRLSVEPRMGNLTLILSEAPQGWKVQDRLVLPDTRQVRTTWDWSWPKNLISPQWEEVEIAAINGNQVTLSAPLQFDHLGAKSETSGLMYLPHVGLLSKNLVISSENPVGNRGHIMIAGRANADFRFSRFKDLGRTDGFTKLDNTVITNGVVTHVGTNQIGRYPVHFHHFTGPSNPTNTGYQYRFIGNTIDNFKVWGLTLHDTSWGLVQNNVIYNGQGSGLLTEEGNEIGNDIFHNFTVRMIGTHSDGKEGTLENELGRGGVGFWYRRSGNNDIGNVAANSTYSGFVFTGYYSGDAQWKVELPVARGVDKHAHSHDGEHNSVLVTNNPVGIFENNEAYGMSRHGLWGAYVSGLNGTADHPIMVFKDFRLWHIGYQATVTIYHTNRIVLDGLMVFNDPLASDRNDTGTTALNFDTYENLNLKISNCRVEGNRYGMLTPVGDGGDNYDDRPTIVENCTFRNYFNFYVMNVPAYLSAGGSTTEIRNTKFETLVTVPANTLKVSGRPYHILMNDHHRPSDLSKPAKIRVYNYNQVSGDDFQVFHKKQARDFVLPQTDPSLLYSRDAGTIGSPEAGLTNQMNFMKYGWSFGATLPTQEDSSTRPEINGFTGPFETFSGPLKIVFVTPWQGAVLTNQPLIRIRYLVQNGKLPLDSEVRFNLDNRLYFSNYNDGGIWWQPEGPHFLKASIIDKATGLRLPNSKDSCVSFSKTFSGVVYPIDGLCP